MSAPTNCPAPSTQPISPRCGRRDLPVMHLIELDNALRPGYRWHTPAVLCRAEIDEDVYADLAQQYEDEQCPGCFDCFRYCRTVCAWRSRPSRRT